MSRTAPLAVDSTHLADHPAVRAWVDLGGGAPAKVELWRRERSKPAIYRLIFEDPRQPAVFVKQSRSAAHALERLVYEELLPRLPLPIPHYHGSCTDAEGSTWLFIEDVGARQPADDDPSHRELAARWLGLLHGAAATRVAGTQLPDAGPARYLRHLRSGRDTIRLNFGNPALAAADRAVLTGVLEHLEALESRWPALEQACEGLPVTLVHGDIRPKNVRIRGADADLALYVIDWEMAGWGVPAADLAGAGGAGPTIPIDLRTYRETVQGFGADLDEASIRRLSVLGRIFQALASTDWAGASLKFDSARYLMAPVASMRVHRAELSLAIKDGAAWLG